MKRRLFLSAACLLSALTLFGQSESAFQFLQLPTSARVAGVGGDNVTLTADDPMVAFHNPALLTWCSEGQLSLGYMNYMEGTNRAGASYTLRPGDRSALAFGGQYLGFGSMSQTAVDGSDMGTFSAKDMLLTALYSYDLSDRWSGGVAAKFIYSNYDIVYSVALGVDLGVNYYDSDNDFSFSLVARQLGGQVKTYDGLHEPLPFSVVAGISKGLAHAPVTVSLTMPDLNRWAPADFYGCDEDTRFGALLLRHMVLGAQVHATDNVYLSLGYDHRRHCELSTSGRRSLAGLSLGAGIGVGRIGVDLAYSRYHAAGNSLLMNISYVL